MTRMKKQNPMTVVNISYRSRYNGVSYQVNNCKMTEQKELAKGQAGSP